MSLAARASRGIAVTAAGQGAKFVLQLASLTVLSRLLDPDDYGLVAMVTIIVGIAAAVSDLGFSLAAVQKTDINQHQKSNLLWISSGVSVAVALAAIALAPLISQFYHRDEVVGLIAALAPMFVINGFGAQFRSELNRSLRFSAITVSEIGGLGLGIAVSIAAAVAGAGYWSLVYLQLLTSLGSCVGFIALSRWRPSLPRRVPMDGLLSFGMSTMATQISNYVSSNTDSVVLGRYAGATQLGIYSRAFQVFNLPLMQLVAPMTRVAVPVLSQIEDEDRYLAYLRRAQMLLCYTLLTIMAVLAGCAAPGLGAVLGEQWRGGSNVLMLLALGGVFQTLGYTYYWVYLSRNKVSTLLVCEGLGRLFMVIFVTLGALHSIEGAAVGYSCGLCVTWLISGRGLLRAGIRPGQLLAVSWRPLIVAGVVFGATAAFSAFGEHQLGLSDPPIVALSVVVALASGGLVFAISPGHRNDISQITELLLRGRRGRSPGRRERPDARHLAPRVRSGS